jgi:spore maturation protein CgeB
MYTGYLKSFYSGKKDIANRSYGELLDLILTDSTEFVASYLKTFREHGIDAGCIIANDKVLQDKWLKEYASTKRFDDIIGTQVSFYKPDILWIEDLRFFSPEWFENIRRRVKSIKLIVACFCAPFNSSTIKKLQACDFVITCTPGLKSDFEKLGIRSYMVYHGFDSGLLEKINNTDRKVLNKAVFTGSLFSAGGYHAGRLELIERLVREDLDMDLFVTLENPYKMFFRNSIFLLNKLIKADRLKRLFPVLEYGNSGITRYSAELIKAAKKPVFGIEMYRIISNYGIVLNNHGDVAGQFAGNMRLFEATGAGTCLLTDDKRNMDELFVRDHEVVVYNSVDECVDKLKWLLDHETERKRIAAGGRKKTLSAHTVENRCRIIKSIIEYELRKK